MARPPSLAVLSTLLLLVILSACVTAVLTTAKKEPVLQSTARFLCIPNPISNVICSRFSTACQRRNVESDDDANEEAWQATGGAVHYMTPLNRDAPLIEQRNTGAIVKATYCSLHPNVPGRRPYNTAFPPGWYEMTASSQRTRAHLWASSFRGSGRYPKNIVAFYHPPNLAMASDFECRIPSAYEDLDLGPLDDVYYLADVLYEWDEEKKLAKRMYLFAFVKFSYFDSDSGTIVQDFWPWIGGFVNNKLDANFIYEHDNTDVITELKSQAMSNLSPNCSPSSGASTIRSLDFYPGMNFNQSPWSLTQTSDGPSVSARTPGAYYTSIDQVGRNKWVHLRATDTLRVADGAAIQFRLVLFETESSEVKFALGGGITLRWTQEGTNSNWVTYEPGVGFLQLATSEVKNRNVYTDVLIVYRKDRTTLYEDGEQMFDVQMANGDDLQMNFSMQVLDSGTDTKMLMSNVKVFEDIFK